MNDIQSKQMLVTLTAAAKICGYEVVEKPDRQKTMFGEPHIHVKAKNATITFPFMPQVRLHQAMAVARHMGLKITTLRGDMIIAAPDNREVVQPFTEFNYTTQLCTG